MSETELQACLERLLADLATWRMPFGRFGPKQCPPAGRFLYDLPYEYLRWFETKGYPKGRLGELLKFVHDVKRDGAEAMFEPLRRIRGAPGDPA